MSNNPHPKHHFKFCPKCGRTTLGFLDNMRFLCSECGFEFYLNVASAVVALIEDEQGRLLLVKRGREPAKGTLDLPGGFVDFGEEAEEAIKREVLEEVNIPIFSLKYFMSTQNRYVYNSLLYRTLDLVFVCHGDFSHILPADDVTECGFYAPDQIRLEQVGLNSIRRIIETYLRHKKSQSSSV